MWRSPALLLALVLITYLEFQFYPGHTYLASATQLYVPILEHLATPGYLTRDLVATNPNVTYTVYDEVTLFLHTAGKLNFHTALVLQQVLCRFAGLVGIYLLARATGLKTLPCVAIATLLNAGTFLTGPNIWLIDPEPIPQAFAVGLMFLAIGCLAVSKPLLSGLFGGTALLYDPTISAPFWIVLFIAYGCDRKLRRLLRPIGPIFLVFILLLANLAQLQQGTPDSQALVTRLTTGLASIEQFRSPDLWISLWPAKFVYLYLALFVIAVWSVTRIWPILNRQMRWLLAWLPAIGVLTLPCSAILLDGQRLAAMLRVEPLHLLIYTVFTAWFGCALAAIRAFRHKAGKEAFAWSAVCLFILGSGLAQRSQPKTDPAISDLATWAEKSTWGSSVFLFPDAGRDRNPGVFRAESCRALWVDWQSGKQAGYHVALTPEWFNRWQMTMRGPMTGDHFETMLSQPIDYYVLNRKYVITAMMQGESRTVKPVHTAGNFAVYDANTLRTVPGNLTIGTARN